MIKKCNLRAICDGGQANNFGDSVKRSFEGVLKKGDHRRAGSEEKQGKRSGKVKGKKITGHTYNAKDCDKTRVS